MNLKWAAAGLTFGVFATVAAPARAQDEPPPRPAALVFEGGLSEPIGPFDGSGPLVRFLPRPYGAVSVYAQMRGAFGWGLSVGGAAGLGWMLGATGRFATPWSHGVRFSTGLGPLLDTGSSFGTAWFATGDATVETRSRGGWAFVAGPRAAVALDSAGVATCTVNVDVDICSGGHVSRGDLILTLRFGVGGAL